MQRSIGLYVHIPFCETKCPYCDFNTYAGIEPLMPAYVAALRTEITVWGRILGRPAVGTVFFGGGTPSYLPAEHIASLIECIGESFEVSREAEVTMEANPDDVVEEKLAGYRDLGVNRLSIGVQSLDDRLLGLLGRRHSASEAVEAFKAATRAGFDDVSIDLMYGLPHQTLADWERTTTAAADLEPQHVSMYCLTLEAGTPMEQWVRSGRMPDPDPDLAADMYIMAEDAMETRVYRHYEISNWARPGRESRHNLTYWRNEPYLGVGPGAHSYLAGHRFSNIRSPKEYVSRLEDGRVPPQNDTLSLTLPRQGGENRSPAPDVRTERAIDADDFRAVPVVEGVEAIDLRMEMAETMMLGLRLDMGIEVDGFVQRFGEAPADAYSDTLDELQSAGLLKSADGRITLTARGRLLGNEVFSRFFAPASTGAGRRSPIAAPRAL